MKVTLHGQVTLFSNILTDIKIARECGYQAIELHTDKLIRCLEAGVTAWQLKDVLDENDIEPAAIDIIGGIETQLSQEKKYLFELTERLCEVASVIGAPTIQVNAFSELEGRPMEEVIGMTAENLQIIADIGLKKGIRFQIEGAAWTPIHTLEHCLELIKQTDRNNVGLVIDFWHFWASRGANPDDIRRLDASLIYGVHLCDGLRPELGEPWPDERELRGCLPGEGDLPVREWMDAVKTTGFEGFVSGEFLNHQLWERDLWDVSLEMRKRIESYL
ncbi:MAG: sugar phosphate isomerase/epimerase [Nitrospina sp.]|nr:sugar phosphate isomerase/epimerase [Nitrospina sp.]